MEPDPMDRPVSQPPKPRWPIYAGLGGAAAASMAFGALVVADSDIRQAEKPPVAEGEPSPPGQESEAGLVSRNPPPEEPEPVPKRLADAFEAATGHRTSYDATENRDVVTTRPLKIVELPFGPALLTEQDSEIACHACVGAIGVYYLREKDGHFEVTGRWPRAVEGWGWGHPPTDWTLTDRFTAYPAIHASGGYLAQGIMMEGTTITELRPSGPATSDVIGISYDDEGSREEGERTCVVKGRIANIRKDRSFDVIATGSVRAVDHYVKRNGRFVARKKIRWDLPCGFWDEETR
jgi:hypothetical protein